MKFKSSKIFKFICISLCFIFFFEQSGFAQVAEELNLSNYLNLLRNSFVQDKFRPVHLRYLSYDNLNNRFSLLLDKGDLKNFGEINFNDLTKTLLNYFFIGITLPNESFWVNLRPDEEDKIIDPLLAQTDVGKILVEADLQLKKDTAKATSPQTPEGKVYWDKLYKKAEEFFGKDNLNIPTLIRPWIVPDEIIIRETENNAYIYKATLKVMLEQDYLRDSFLYSFKDERLKALNEYSAQLIRELILPKLTKEVNTSKRYAPLRQVYYSLILAQWFKQRFYGRGGLYSWLINKKQLTGLASKEPWSKTTYFKEYQQSFKKGEYNLQEPVYAPYGQTIRSYFSGGIDFSVPIPEAGGINPTVTSIVSKRRGGPFPVMPFNKMVEIFGNGGTVENPTDINIINIKIPTQKEQLPEKQPPEKQPTLTLSPNISINKSNAGFLNTKLLATINLGSLGGLLGLWLIGGPLGMVLGAGVGLVLGGITIKIQDYLEYIKGKDQDLTKGQRIVFEEEAERRWEEEEKKNTFSSIPSKFIPEAKSVFMVLVKARVVTEGNITKIFNLLTTIAKSAGDYTYHAYSALKSLAEAVEAKKIERIVLDPNLLTTIAKSAGNYTYNAYYALQSLAKALEAGRIEFIIQFIEKLNSQFIEKLNSAGVADRYNINNILFQIRQVAPIALSLWFERKNNSSVDPLELVYILSLDEYVLDLYRRSNQDANENLIQPYFDDPKFLHLRYLLAIAELTQDYSEVKEYCQKITPSEIIRAILLNKQNNIITQTTEFILDYVNQGKGVLAGMAPLRDKVSFGKFTLSDLMGILEKTTGQSLSGEEISDLLLQQEIPFKVHNGLIVPLGFEVLLSAYRGHAEVDHKEANYLTHAVTTAIVHYGFQKGEARGGEGANAFHEFDLLLMMLEGRNNRQVDSIVGLAFHYNGNPLPEYARKRTIVLKKGNVASLILKLLREQYKERKAQQNLLKLFKLIEEGKLEPEQLEAVINKIGEQLKILRNDCGLKDAYFEAVFGHLDEDFFSSLRKSYQPSQNNLSLLKSLLIQAMQRQLVLKTLARGKESPEDRIEHPWIKQEKTLLDYLEEGEKIRKGTFEEVDISDDFGYILKNKPIISPSQIEGIKIKGGVEKPRKSDNNLLKEGAEGAILPARDEEGRGLPINRQYEISPQTGQGSMTPDSGKGGIDFRNLPIVTQPMNMSFSPATSLKEIPSLDLTKECQEIERMLNAGIIPSAQRIKEYLLGCCQNGGLEKEIDKTLSFIAEILRLEEEFCSPTGAALKEILVLLESNKPANELQLFLNKIEVLPQ